VRRGGDLKAVEVGLEAASRVQGGLPLTYMADGSSPPQKTEGTRGFTLVGTC